jgi:hypothetical protein
MSKTVKVSIEIDGIPSGAIEFDINCGNDSDTRTFKCVTRALNVRSKPFVDDLNSDNPNSNIVGSISYGTVIECTGPVEGQSPYVWYTYGNNYVAQSRPGVVYLQEVSEVPTPPIQPPVEPPDVQGKWRIERHTTGAYYMPAIGHRKIGANIAYGAVTATSGLPGAPTPRYSEYFKNASQGHASKFWRIFCASNTIPDDTLLNNIQFMLDEMAKYGQYAVICFTNTGGSHGLDMFRSSMQPHIPGPHPNWFKDNNLINDYLVWVAKIVNRFKGHPAVMMWELGNEWRLDRVYGHDIATEENSQEVVNFFSRASDHIWALDQSHPISLGVASIFEIAPENRVSDPSYPSHVYSQLPNVRVVSNHIYPKRYEWGHEQTQWEHEWRTQTEMAYAKQSGRLHMLGEFGAMVSYDDRNGECHNHYHDRTEQTQSLFNRLPDTSLFMQWGYMDETHDVGIGDRVFGFAPPNVVIPECDYSWSGDNSLGTLFANMNQF